MTTRLSNFGRNVDFQPKWQYRPRTVTEVLEILTRHRGEEIRAVGSLHSWSEAAATTGVTLDLRQFDSVKICEDGDGKWVTVGAGCTLKRLVQHLAAHKLTLPSLGLIDEQTVAGATATGTHGSGKHSLSSYVQGASIAHYDENSGEAKITTIDDGPELMAARCSLGLMGVIVSLKLRCRSRYNIQEHVRAHSSLESVMIQESDYPQQQFYLMPWSWQYFGQHRVETKLPRSAMATIYRAYCFLVIDVGMHVAVCGLVNRLRVNGLVRFFYRRILPVFIVRHWKVVDDSHAMLTMEHELFRHIEIEVFVQRREIERATQLLVDVISVFGGGELKYQRLTEPLLRSTKRWDELELLRGAYVHHYPICFRRILSDETLISMASPGTRGDEDWYSISLISLERPNRRTGFHQFADFVAQSFAELFGGRCHWGKYNPLDRDANDNLYPQMDEFRRVIGRFDSDGAFKNDWLRKLF